MPEQPADPIRYDMKIPPEPKQSPGEEQIAVSGDSRRDKNLEQQKNRDDQRPQGRRDLSADEGAADRSARESDKGRD